MKRKKLYFFIVLMVCVSCTGNNKEELIDTAKLTGGDYRLFKYTPAWELAKAVKNEDLSEIKEILEKEPNLVNYQEPKYGNTLVHLTIINQQIKSFKELLANKADIHIHNTYDGASPLIEACMFSRYDIEFVRILLKNGANVNDVEVGKRREGNSTRFSPLIAASRAGAFGLMKLLTLNGADINYQNEYRQSALSSCVMQNKYDIAIFLLQNGADYKRPVFYRFGHSVPYDPKEDKAMYIVDVLREDFMELDSEEYKYKMQVVAFLKAKGIDYRASPIPSYIRKKAQEKYPKTWQKYLEKY